MSTTARHRAIRRAVRAWQGGRPHEALELLAEAGMKDQWPEFIRAAHADARRRFKRAMIRR